MATWQANVFVNSQVGRIRTEVEASSYEGARQQIYAKHGDVQTISNLQRVRSSSVSSESDSSDSNSGMLLLIFIAIALIMNYWYYILPAAIVIGLLWWFATK